MSVPADVMLAVRTSRSLIIAFLVGCLDFGFTEFMVVSTEVIVSAVTAGSAGTIVLAGIDAAGVTVAAGAGVL